MAERTVPKDTPPSVDDDAISITSTQSEEYSSEEEFLVERVLAEKKDRNNRSLYLILWAGYPDEKSTWEPKKNIQDPGILEAWAKRKSQEALGTKTAFDLAGLDARIAEIEKARVGRHLRRNAIRRRLGIPVASPEGSEPEDASGNQIESSESVEAEAKEQLENEPVVKREAILLSRSQNKAQTTHAELELPNRELRHKAQGNLQQDEENGSSDLDRDLLVGNKKKAQKKALADIRRKRSAQQGLKVSGVGDLPAAAKSLTEEHGNSMPDIDTQLLEEERQHQKPVLNTAQTLHQFITPSATTQSSLPKNTLHDERPTNPLRRPFTDEDQPAARGRGATRGGHLAPRNVFERREPTKKRPSLLETSSDPNKGQKLFPNWHSRRKAELAGRDLADAAPDLAALGGLFDPSNPSSFQPLSLATLRQRASKSAVLAHHEVEQPGAIREPTENADNTTIETTQHIPSNSSNINESSDISTTDRPVYVYERHGTNAICYFWYHKGDCSRGSGCHFSHSDHPRRPIVPNPNKAPKSITEREIPKNRLSEASSPPIRRRRFSEICFFWHKSNACARGTACAFVHDNFADFPVACEPHSHRSDSSPHYHSAVDSRSAEEDRQAQKEEEDREVKGRRREGTPPLHNKPCTAPVGEDALAGAAGIEPSTRPPWDPQDPFRAICYFWLSGPCSKGSDCMYIHSSQSDLPLAPPPNDKSAKPCKFWSRSDCYRGERCPYMHSSRTLDPQTLGVAPPRKVVSFAVDELETEPDRLIPVHQNKVPRPPPEDAEQLDTTSNFRSMNERYREEQNPGSDHSKKAVQGIRYSNEQAANGDAILNYLEPVRDSKLADDLHSHPTLQLSDKLQSRPSLESSDVEMMTMMNPKLGEHNTQLNHRLKQVIFGNDEPQSIVLDFGDIGEASQQAWGQSFSRCCTFHFRQMCTAQDFKALYGTLPRAMLWAGNLAANPADKSDLVKMNKFFQYLRLYAGGLISASTDFSILIYPAIEEWKVLGASVPFLLDESLRYLIFEPSFDIGKLLAPKGDAPTLFRKTLVKSLHGLRYRKFLHVAKPDIVHHFYLMFPSRANQTAAFFASWLRASDPRCKVYSSQTEGSWNFLVSCPEIHAGAIFIHESMVPYISEVPSLKRLINPPTNNKMFSFWCVDDSSHQYPIFQSLETSNLGQISVVRIFPHGHAILLTPSFLVAEPEKAYSLINWFRKKVKPNTPGTWKLVCAHDIRSYLLELALDKSFERDQFYEENHDKPAKDSWAAERGLSYQACEDRFKCHELISDLLQESMKGRLLEPFGSDQSRDSATLIVLADESIDPDDEPSLITWFAGWSLRNLDKFRKYTVVGTNSSSSKKAMRIKQFDIGGRADRLTSNAPSSSTMTPSSITNPRLDKGSPEVSMGSGIETKVSTSLGGASNPGIPFDASRNATKEATPVPFQNRNSPQTTLSDFGIDSVEMDVSPDGDGTIFTQIRTVDPESTPEILFFCSITGCNLQTARRYLSNSNDNIRTAVQLFKTHNSREHMDQMDIDDPILEMIASVKAEQLPPRPTGSSASQTSGPTPISSNSSARLLPPVQGVPQTEVYASNYTPTSLSPPQFDSLGEQSRQQDKTKDSVTLKTIGDTNERPLSTNMRLKTMNDERNGSLRDSTLSEDGEANRNLCTDNVLRPTGPSLDTSRRESYASLMVQSPEGENMDVDSPQPESNRILSTNGTTLRNGSGDRTGTAILYVSTTSWYRSLAQNGKGWGHIHVDGAENCLKIIGVK